HGYRHAVARRPERISAAGAVRDDSILLSANEAVIALVEDWIQPPEHPFMKRLILFHIALIFLLVCAHLATASQAVDALPRSAPETQGVSSAGLLAFLEAADQQLDGMHSFMLVRHGHVVAEGWWTPYDPQSNHELYSL